MTESLTSNELLIWLNIIVTLGGFVAVYVRLIERVVRVETLCNTLIELFRPKEGQYYGPERRHHGEST